MPKLLSTYDRTGEQRNVGLEALVTIRGEERGLLSTTYKLQKTVRPLREQNGQRSSIKR